MTDFDLDRRVRIPAEVLVRQLDEQAVLLHLGTGFYFGLNEIGRRIWQLLQEHVTLEEALEVLENEYEVDRSRLRQDLMDLVRQLVEHRLVEFDAD